MMFWMRMLMIGGFSVTAATLFLYQGIEILHAFTDYFHEK